MSDRDASDEYEVGYGKAPVATRFRKGQSGNPNGRPRGSKKQRPYDGVLGQMVTVREDGRERKVTAAEAFLLHMTKKGLEGDGPAAREAMAAIEAARASRVASGDEKMRLVWRPVAPGAVDSVLEPLKMAAKLDRYRATARMALEPWLVEAALARLGDRKLDRHAQEVVVKATRTPLKVKWPEWWEVLP
ncbi:DUF5681 domain-containing protein [Parasphingopyxis marina]|uniref:DUF5681 domain-containing protein n=1 Tax=Parasphingopyxis marina TaxID=2761622 RepID=A0A842HW74_9SPHN|nr:DUF5681 domain-containing protein [Parasphingopyxis marina]MBC2776611.1 hypothetical protein [Parasphingopyxis marina]